jgi:multiple sugar transport system substrate-binding protein
VVNNRSGRLRIAVSIVVALLFGLTAGVFARETVTVTLFHHWLEGRQHLLEELIRRFEADNPDIKVEQIAVGPGMTDRRQKLFSLTAANLTPDVVMIDRFDIPEYSNKGIIAPLSNLIKRDGIDLSIFFPAEIENAYYQSDLWALPLTTGSGNQIIYYNKDHFAQAGMDENQFPKTWPELEAAAKKLTYKDGDKFTQIAFEPWRSSANESPIFGVWLLNNGGRFLSPDGRTVLFGSPEGVAAADWVARFAAERYGGQEGLRSFPRPGGYNDFYQGKVTMWVHGPPFLYLITQNAPELRFGTAMPPAAPGFERKNIMFGGWAYAMSRTTKHPEAAWRLLKYLTVNREAAGWFLKSQDFRPSPLRAVMNSADYRRDNPHIGTFIEAMLNTVPVPTTVVTPQILNEVATIFGRIMSGMTASQVVHEVAQKSQLLLDEALRR